MTTHHSLYSQIPATDRLLREPRIHAAVERFGHTATVEMLRLLQDEARCAIQAENALPDWCAAWEQEAALGPLAVWGVRGDFFLFFAC